VGHLFKNLLGIVYCEQKGDSIRLGGLAVESLARDIKSTWSTSKINDNMFTDLGRRSIEFPLFYALEVHYMLRSLLKNRRNYTNRRTIETAIRELEQNTWLANTVEGKEFPKVLDRSKLNLFYKTPLPHQLAFFDVYEKGKAQLGLNGYLLSAAAGSGKEQPLYANIKVPNGWKVMGEMKVGDTVVGWDGRHAKVTGVFPQGLKPIYRLITKDGREVEAGAEHLWRVYNNREVKTKSDYCRIINTLEIQEKLSSGKRVHIDLMSPDEGEEISLPVDPYLLGVFIGDGSSANGAITITKNDTELFEKVSQKLPEGVTLVERACGEKARTFGITRTDKSKPNPLTEALKSVDLMFRKSWEKFIPEKYFLASKLQRFDLLQGLMDTDGTVSNPGGTISYCTTSDQLALDVQRLVWSLGGIASISAKQTHFTFLGMRKPGRLAYQVNIRMKKPSDAFSLTRKKSLTNDDNQYAENLKLEIIRVEEAGLEECQCIMIDHPDHLYVTDNYIVTHNTLTDLMIAEMVGSDYVVIVSPNNAIHRVWKAALIGEKREYKKEQPYWMVSEGKPYKNERFLITHYEGLEKLMAVVNRLHGKVTVVLDESHNFNEIKSNRTQLFLTLCERAKSENVIWASGTPIKALGGECVPLLKSIDPLFTPKVEASFRQIFGVNAQRALDILRNRMSTITFLVEKSAVQQTKPITHEIRVKIPDGENYTLDAISRQMSEYVAQQLDHYKTNYQSYQDVYDHCLQVFADNITDAKVKEDFATYKRYVVIVKRNPDPRFTANEMKFCNDFESQQIAPALNQDDRKAFKGAKSVIKYVDLVVRGQALGNVLGKARSRLHVEMLKYIDFDAILSQAEKKTVVFTSYVDVVKAAESLFKSKGMRPLTAWAETNKNLASNVAAFEKDPKVNPMVATFNSLSTAVPLIMADLSIFLNVPWRDGELVQAKARTDRLGQDTQVKYFMVYLDTGKEPNISTRSKEILEWSRAQVAAIMGQDYNGEAAKTMDSYIASLEGYHDLDYNPQEVIVSFESALNNVLDLDLDTTGF